MKRVMCLDYGDARIGVALTDPLQIIVSAYCTLQNDESAIDRIREIFIEKEVYELVIGLPYDQNGELGAAAFKILSFAAKIKSAFDAATLSADYYYQDERYTTRDANDTIKSIGVRKKRRKAVVDQIAACNILKSYLDSRYKEKINFELDAERLEHS